MIKKLHITSLLFLFVAFNNVAQEQFTIYGVVKNNLNEIIPDVKLQLKDNDNTIYRTNSSGEYFINLNKKVFTQIEVSHVGYETKTIELNKKLWRKTIKDTLYLNIKLSDLQLTEIVISGTQKPNVIFGSETSSISDFEFYEDKLLLLSYEKSLEKDPILKLVDYNQNLIHEYKAPKDAVRLFKDYQDNLYLITQNITYFIHIFKNEIRIRPVEQELFNKFTSKIIDTLNEHFLYSNFQDNFPAFDYYAQNKFDTIAQKIHHVENKFMMDLYRAEFKYVSTKEKLWAYRQELKTGIDKEIWIGATSFTNSLYYESLYAPLFVKEDTVLIFDHYNDMLFKTNEKFKKIDSVAISYHKFKEGKNWEQPLLKDKELQKVYALFERGGYHYLKPINLTTGLTKTAFKFYYRFVENPKVKDGYAYYIYRPFESAQRKYLYRELIVD